MDEETRRQWWPLHIRAARGESLTQEERTLYEKVQQQLDAEEYLHFDMAGLRRAREQIKELEAERLQLEARRQELQSRIARLEAAMSERDKAAEEHAAIDEEDTLGKLIDACQIDTGIADISSLGTFPHYRTK